jgi:D-beta-D-heptose 7-phosphate kinase/D-beta-D-heptose 1-phosphate adenosyltransferase
MITTFEELPDIRERHRDKRIAYVNGVFDLLHEGHLSLMELTKSLGEIAVIGILPDERVRAGKGPSRPVQPEVTRLSVVSALKPVDYAFITPVHPQPYRYTGHQIVDQLRPDVFVTSYGGWRDSEEWLSERGTELVVVPRLNDEISTTSLLSGYVSRLSGDHPITSTPS